MKGPRPSVIYLEEGALMKVQREGEVVRMTLEAAESRLLRYALERALFIDTPAQEQMAIASFCTKALELLEEGRRP